MNCSAWNYSNNHANQYKEMFISKMDVAVPVSCEITLIAHNAIISQSEQKCIKGVHSEDTSRSLKCTLSIHFEVRHRTCAYFGSAVQVQRKSILSAALLMCPPPTWDFRHEFSNEFSEKFQIQSRQFSNPTKHSDGTCRLS